MRRYGIGAAAAAIVCAGASAGAASGVVEQPAIALLPQETLAFYYSEPKRTGLGPGAPVEWVLRGLELAGQLGQLSDRTRLIADLLNCLPILGRYPHAVALLDVQATEFAPGAYRLGSLKAVLILQTDVRNEMVERRIRALLGTQTNADVSRLDQVEYAGVPAYRLSDSRLPAWAVVEWAEIGRFYVIGVGDGALRQVVETARAGSAGLTTDAWFDWAYGHCRGAQANTMWLVRFDALRSVLARVIRDRTERVIHSLGAWGVEQSFWSVGRSGRAITAYCALRNRGEDRVITISDPAAAPAALLAAVPPEAPSFAVIDVNVAEWVRRVCRAYLASQSVSMAEGIEAWWADLQRRLGLDAEAQILDQLGEHIVLHTYPEHPWRVPLLCTLLFEIKGDAASVRRCLDGLLAAWQAALAGGGESQPGRRFGPQLRRSDEGVWYFQFGVLTVLGIAVEDRWIVVSYSPKAVLANMVFLEREPADASLESTPPAARSTGTPGPRGSQP